MKHCWKFIFTSLTSHSSSTLDNHTCTWTAMDDSTGESTSRTYKLVFSDITMQESFCNNFNEVSIIYIFSNMNKYFNFSNNYY